MFNFEEAERYEFVNKYARQKHVDRCIERAEEGKSMIDSEFVADWFDDNEQRLTYDCLVVVDWITKSVIERYSMDEIAQANQDYIDRKWEHAEQYMPGYE